MGVTRRGILRSIMMRDFELVERLIDDKIRKTGWSKTAELLSRMKRRDHVPGNPQFPVREGTFRDMMIQVLGLDDIEGLDVDLPLAFNDVEATSLDELRHNILEPSIEFLREQVSRRNTFFLDPERMSTTPYAVVISDLLEARNDELGDLSAKPTLREVFSTYYGFTVITMGSVKSRYAGAARESIEGIETLSAQIGDKIKIPAKIIKRSKAAFDNCSEYMKKLLWGMLRVAASGYDRQSTAGRVLGTLGDSRALPLLHSKLEGPNWVASSIVEAVGQIGHPSSLAPLEKLLQNRYMRKNAISALGGIRDDSVISILDRTIDSSRRDVRFAIEALGETRRSGAVPILNKIFRNKRGRNRVHAMNALMEIGPEGMKVLQENSQSVAKAIRSRGIPSKAITVAQAIPGFIWETGTVSAIADVIIKPSHTKRVLEALRDLPEILVDLRVVNSIVKVYEDAAKPVHSYSSRGYTNYRQRRRSYRAQRMIRRFQYAGLPSALARALRAVNNSRPAAQKIRKCDELMKPHDLREAVFYVLQNHTMLAHFESWF